MTEEQAKTLINLMSDKGISFEPGLSSNKVAQIEQRFGIRFPPDLKLFLQSALPISEGFVDWRSGLHSNK